MVPGLAKVIRGHQVYFDYRRGQHLADFVDVHSQGHVHHVPLTTSMVDHACAQEWAYICTETDMVAVATVIKPCSRAMGLGVQALQEAHDCMRGPLIGVYLQVCILQGAAAGLCGDILPGV